MTDDCSLIEQGATDVSSEGIKTAFYQYGAYIVREVLWPVIIVEIVGKPSWEAAPTCV